MKVTFLGTGTSQGVPVIGCDCEVCQSTNTQDHRLRTSVLIESLGQQILIDAGPDFRQQMLRAKVQELHAILLTHEHNDHIIGLDDVRPFNFKWERDMPVYCLQRVATDLKKRFAYAFSKNPYPGAPQFQLHDINADDPFSIADLTFTPIEVIHGDLSVLGFRLEDFTYITDAKYIAPESVAKIKGSRILVLNALHHSLHHSHFNLEEALAFAKEIGAEKTYLTHISHRMGLQKSVNAQLPSGVFLAHDGLTLVMESVKVS